ncbi:MAG: SDR family oxidoreductase [Gammaproteobacteria bacterium]|nr:SDR family oxidoreductase [Gammaproteobacteria bacterium]MBM4209538.1 SDR family oxidoreductase [Gammaproteobacteria bacterium]MBM4223392.1 SDR family oxidoreductase [Gammaproteobacteria bacterium]
MTTSRLAGKVALVTGAGREGGLGEAICLRLAAEGAAILVTDIAAAKENLPADRTGSMDEVERVVARIAGHGGRAAAAALDVRDEAQVSAAVGSAVKHFGGLDIVINNAGVGYLMEPLIEMSIDRWQTVLGVNLTGAFLCSKHAARQMIAQGRGGRIINIASVAAKSGSLHLAAYAASKHGLIGLTRSAALELGTHGITVNAVCPNHVTTQLGSVQNAYRAKQRGQTVDEYLAEMRGRIPLGRVGLAEDTAKACAFLCSNEASYMTGEAMNVSGGQEVH